MFAKIKIQLPVEVADIDSNVVIVNVAMRSQVESRVKPSCLLEHVQRDSSIVGMSAQCKL